MFTLKLKGDNKTEGSNKIELKLKGNIRTINNYNDIEKVVSHYKVEEIKIKIEDKFYPVWSMRFNDFKQSYICEGIDRSGS